MRPQPCFKNLQKTKECQEWEKHSFPGRTHQLVIQYEMVSPEKINTRNMIQIEQDISRNVYVYAYSNKHVTTINEQEAKHLNERALWKGLDGRKIEGNDAIILKSQK